MPMVDWTYFDENWVKDQVVIRGLELGLCV
jgi:hypothetical protein